MSNWRSYLAVFILLKPSFIIYLPKYLISLFYFFLASYDIHNIYMYLMFLWSQKYIVNVSVCVGSHLHFPSWLHTLTKCIQNPHLRWSIDGAWLFFCINNQNLLSSQTFWQKFLWDILGLVPLHLEMLLYGHPVGQTI